MIEVKKLSISPKKDQSIRGHPDLIGRLPTVLPLTIPHANRIVNKAPPL